MNKIIRGSESVIHITARQRMYLLFLPDEDILFIWFLKRTIGNTFSGKMKWVVFILLLRMMFHILSRFIFYVA